MAQPKTVRIPVRIELAPQPPTTFWRMTRVLIWSGIYNDTRRFVTKLRHLGQPKNESTQRPEGMGLNRLSTPEEVAALPLGSVIRSTNGVAVLMQDGWVVSGYIYPRTHEDVEEFIGGYPVTVLAKGN